MARGPFQGTWQAGVRPTVVSAPDAIVYINGESDMLACNNCRRRFDLNKYITSIQVDLSVENAPGSANINLSVPRHTVDDFMVEGEPIISPMMEVEIYAKGFYLLEGLPQYYPIFWGLVTEVSDSYSGGEHTFSINCADILKWWELCKMNVNPAFTQPAGQMGSNYAMGNIFHGANVYDIIWTLAQQSFGDVVNATGSLVSAIKEQKQKETFRRALSDIMGYWNSRFGKIRSNLMLYGVQGSAVRGDLLYEAQPRGGGRASSKFASKAVRAANGGAESSQLLFDPENVNPFRSDIAQAGNPNLWQSEYQTKLEIANACKEAVGFEFFMDVTGDIVFKPPFYNLDILSNKPVSWIQDIDIISWDFSSSEAEVVTHLQMQGSFEGGPMSFGVTSDFNTPYTQIIDYHLLRKYGWRTQSFNAEYLSSTFDMFYAGVDMLDRMNAKRHRASLEIPLRPELRLGFPLYIAPKDQIWYLQGISHNIQMGGRASTNLTLSAKREKFIAPRGIGTLELTGFKKQGSKETSPLVDSTAPTTKELSRSGVFKLKIGDAAEIPQLNQTETGLAEDPYAPLILRHPKTGRVVGYPNVVMAYTRPYQPDDKTLKKNLGENLSPERKVKKIRDKEAGTASKENLDLVASSVTQTNDRRLADKHMNNRYIYGLTSAGVYSYVHETRKAIKELVLLQAQNIEYSQNGQTVDSASLLGTTAIMRPVSDERGFELVGHFRYGRGVSLRDGSLVLSKDGGTNQRADVAIPLALSGGLFETLTAQSQGLSALSSSFPNPADAVSRLTPDELQTAATLNPDTKKPDLVTGGTNFVDVAPLGSPKNQGVPINVEVSQFSKALTLAEMKVKEDVASTEECVCLTGRSDLAFINSGYQVETLSATGEDKTDLSTEDNGVGTSVNVSLVQSLQDQIAAYEAEQDAAREAGDPLADQLYVKEISELQAQVTELQTSASNGSAVSPRTFAPSRTEVMTRVETFLINLYEALDTPHQKFEKELRGNFLPGRTRGQILGTEPVPSSQFGRFSPPFSVLSSTLGGDPRRLAIQGETSREGMANAWKDFGDDLRRKPEQKRLRDEIRNIDKNLRLLDKEEKNLQEAQRTNSVVLLSDGTTVSQRLEAIAVEREKALHDRENAQGRLNVLNNEDR